MTSLIAATAAVLLAQGPMCGGQYDITPDKMPFTGCFIPSGRGDGSGAQIRVDPMSGSGYRATPVPRTPMPWEMPPPGQ